MFSTSMALVALIVSLVFATIAAGSTVINDVHHTFYGFPDNSPPGPATAYDCGYGRGYTAGGAGTYADPLTFATAPGEYNKCEIIWDPYVRKYLIFQDTCAQCITGWKTGIKHIDLWLGSPTHTAHKTVKQCGRALTPNEGQPVVRRPSKDLDADGELIAIRSAASTSETDILRPDRPLFHNGVYHTERVHPQ